MKKNLPWIMAGVLVACVVVVILWPRKETTEPPAAVTPEPPTEVTEPPVVEPPPPPPVAQEPEVQVEPLPALEDSDAEIRRSLVELADSEAVQTYVVPAGIIRKMVVTVDNLPRDKVSMRVRAVPDLPGRFAVSGSEDAPLLGEANFVRYRPFVAAVDALDAVRVVEQYRRWYPLFQQAYEELGYPGKALHSRVIECIDDLLAAPQVPAGTPLVRPKVLYEFADPDLEARSAGQKMLMRMGPENAARVKSKLQEIRERLTQQSEAGWPTE